MAYKDKEQQKAAVKQAVQRYRAKNNDSALSSQKQVSQNASGCDVIPEVSNTRPVIPIKVQLQAWARGEGTSQQESLGILAGQYDLLKDTPKDLIHTLNTKTVAELEAEGYWVPCWKLNTDQTYEQIHQTIASINLPTL